MRESPGELGLLGPLLEELDVELVGGNLPGPGAALLLAALAARRRAARRAVALAAARVGRAALRPGARAHASVEADAVLQREEPRGARDEPGLHAALSLTRVSDDHPLQVALPARRDATQ